MQHGMHMIDLAEALNNDRARRSARRRVVAGSNMRAGPAAGFPQRFGRRLIAVGERMAYGRSQVVTR